MSGAVATGPGSEAASTDGVSTADRGESHAYDLFILVLTILSLVIMVLLVLPLTPATQDLLTIYDNLICIVFLGDFALRMARAPSRRQYFVYERGWLDLLGSMPSLGVLRFTGLLRLARLSRLARVMRLLSGKGQKALVADIVRNRGEYAAFVTVLLAFIVLVTSSILVLEVEDRAADGNIKTGGDALWWAFVTITTVGYGDRYPVTFAGRVIAVFVMFAGVGIIGSLASILASVLVPTPEENKAAAAETAAVPAATPADAAVLTELSEIRRELAALRQAATDGAGSPGRAGPETGPTSAGEVRTQTT